MYKVLTADWTAKPLFDILFIKPRVVVLICEVPVPVKSASAVSALDVIVYISVKAMGNVQFALPQWLTFCPFLPHCTNKLLIMYQCLMPKHLRYFLPLLMNYKTQFPFVYLWSNYSSVQ